MKALDTRRNYPESDATLLLQQRDLIDGRRDVQMFPVGTKELNLPTRMARSENERGVFHFDPSKISAETILSLSDRGRENEFLQLGPFCKDEIVARIIRGERLIGITEYNADGIEIRCAAGTQSTRGAQQEFFHKTKHLDSVIVAGPLPKRVSQWL